MTVAKETAPHPAHHKFDQQSLLLLMLYSCCCDLRQCGLPFDAGTSARAWRWHFRADRKSQAGELHVP